MKTKETPFLPLTKTLSLSIPGRFSLSDYKAVETKLCCLIYIFFVGYLFRQFWPK